MTHQKLRSTAPHKNASARQLNETGMTLIEIMIVMAIIGLLLAVLGTTANNYLRKSRIEATKIQIKEMGKALDAYNLSCNTYPTTEQGLAALTQSPGAEACPNWGPDPYLKKISKDPFGGQYIYESDGTTYELKSYGGDKKPGGEGYNADISSKDLE